MRIMRKLFVEKPLREGSRNGTPRDGFTVVSQQTIGALFPVAGLRER